MFGLGPTGVPSTSSASPILPTSSSSIPMRCYTFLRQKVSGPARRRATLTLNLSLGASGIKNAANIKHK